MNFVKIMMCAAGILVGASMQASKDTLKELTQKRQDVSQKRAALVSKLSQIISESNAKGLALSKELAVFVQELSCLENLSNKKRTGEHIKELREKLEASKKQFVRVAASEEFATAAKELEAQLALEERLAHEEAALRAYLCEACGKVSASKKSTLSCILKPTLAFTAGAAVIALLHWRKIITIPQA